MQGVKFVRIDVEDRFVGCFGLNKSSLLMQRYCLLDKCFGRMHMLADNGRNGGMTLVSAPEPPQSSSIRTLCCQTLLFAHIDDKSALQAVANQGLERVAIN